jgi:membrane protease YdiL (CAAX protease family)
MFKNPWAGILVTAFIFSAIHLQFYGFIPRFILGILLVDLLRKW